MIVWAIADLHLSFGAPDKSMEVFGPRWSDYQKRLHQEWSRLVAPEDLVLIAGDIAWALHPQEAKKDLDWLDALPGIKVLLKGNHDYWWGSVGKTRSLMPPSCHLIQNSAYNYQGIGVGGARLWETSTYQFLPNLKHQEADETIFKRELQRLELSLSALDPQAKIRIAMTHYPPITSHLEATAVTQLFEKYKIDIALFGHLHNMELDPYVGERGGVRYYLVAADMLKFAPLKIYEG